MTESKKNSGIKRQTTISYEIPVEGSLGLLALGAVGIMEWRKVRDANSGKKKE